MTSAIPAAAAVLPRKLVGRVQKVPRQLYIPRAASVSAAIWSTDEVPTRPVRMSPTAPMKASGVEWLGDIPAHWEVKRTKIVARLASGHTPSRQHPEYWVDCTIPWFSLGDVWQLRDGRREYIEEEQGLRALDFELKEEAVFPQAAAYLYERK